ncbi:MAG: hypothetical protein ACRCYU_12110 [Nocardioides sp.]
MVAERNRALLADEDDTFALATILRESASSWESLSERLLELAEYLPDALDH